MSMNTSPQMLLPLSQRSLSPASYQQLQTQQTDARGNIIGQIPGAAQPISGLKQPQKIGQGGSGQSGGHSPQANQPSSRDFTHKRQILHKSMNSSGGVQPVVKSTSNSIDNGAKEMINQRHAQVKSNGPPDQRAHHATLNMSSHMISARQQPPGVNDQHQSLNVGLSTERGPLGGQNQQDGGAQGTGIHLSKKFSGHRKRNAREKSYDLYNQKLQLPPMQKPGQDSLNIGSNSGINRQNNAKQERTYSLPSTSHVHQMPLSPNIAAMQSIASPKNMSHPIPQRQSINDALKSQVQSIQQSSGGQGSGNNVQNRFGGYSTGASSGGQIAHQSGGHQKIYNGHKSNNQPQHQSSNSQNANNINSMKGFFSARGQGIRSGGGVNDVTAHQTSASHDLTGKGSGGAQMHHPQQRSGQMVTSSNGQIQGMFSPRRNIMSGQNNNGPSFVGKISTRDRARPKSRRTSKCSL